MARLDLKIVFLPGGRFGAGQKYIGINKDVLATLYELGLV
jgi:hypothetical protein